MAITAAWWVSAAVPAVLLVVAWFYYNYWITPEGILDRFKRQGIPSCAFRPFLGNIPEIQEAKKHVAKSPPSVRTAIPFLELMDKRLGGTYTYCYGPTPRLVTSDPALIRQIFISKEENFPKIPAASGLLFGNGLSTVSGERWHRQRGMLNAVFLPREIKRIVDGVVDSTSEAIARWRSLIGRERSAEFQMHEELSSLALNVIGRVVFGADIDGMRVVAAKVIPLLAEYLELVPEWLQAGGLIPGYRYMPTALKVKLTNVEKHVKDLMLGLIQRRRMARNMRAKDTFGNDQNLPQGDLLELMLGAMDDGPAHSGQSLEARKTDVDRGHMDNQQVMDECVTLVTAGYETMAALLTWTILLLAKYPDWQERLREEVREVCGEADKGNPIPVLQYEHLDKLRNLHMVIQESLRLFPPSTLLSRKCSKDTSLVGLKIPQGTEIILPVIQIHRRKDVWGDDVDAFKPERFAEGLSGAVKDPLAYIPFGVGSRNCLGQDVAIAEAKIMLAVILQSFKWLAAPTYRHCPLAGLTLKPKYGMPIILEKLTQT